MPNITLSVNNDLKHEMDKHSSVKWSTAVRSIIQQKLLDFAESERVARKSRLSFKDWEKINPKLSKSAARHAEALLHESNC